MIRADCIIIIVIVLGAYTSNPFEFKNFRYPAIEINPSLSPLIQIKKREFVKIQFSRQAPANCANAEKTKKFETGQSRLRRRRTSVNFSQNVAKKGCEGCLLEILGRSRSRSKQASNQPSQPATSQSASGQCLRLLLRRSPLITVSSAPSPPVPYRTLPRRLAALFRLHRDSRLPLPPGCLHTDDTP